MDAINKEGITVFEADGSKVSYPKVQASLSGECQADVDLILVIVKAFDTESAMEANRNLIKDHTMIMTLQNGGGNDLKLA